MSANQTSPRRRTLLWSAVAVVVGALLGTNPFYQPHLPVPIGVAAWFADTALVLILAAHPVTARLGLLVAGSFLAVPFFLWSSPLARFMLICVLLFPLALAAATVLAPPRARFRERMGFFFSWLGTRQITPRARSFDAWSLLRLSIATVVLYLATHLIKTVSAGGLWLLVRWLAGGVAMLSFAEMLTASHDFLTALMGIAAPSLMRSPFLSTSMGEFWTKRWNIATSELVFRPIFFEPLARHGIALALFAAFLVSGVGHALLAAMALGRWKISIIFGAYFLTQPPLILAERGMKVHRWPPIAAWAWTLAALAVTSPLVVEPLAQIVGSTLRAADSVVPLTIGMLGLATGINLFFAFGQLVFCRTAGESDDASGKPQMNWHEV